MQKLLEKPGVKKEAAKLWEKLREELGKDLNKLIFVLR
jgi:hypothetical protein